MSHFRYFRLLVLTVLGLYVVSLALSYVLYPEEPSGRGIDTLDSERSLYFTDPKYLVFTANRLHQQGSRVVLLGASNVKRGLRPREISPLLGGVTVDNLSIGGSNISTTSQVVDLVYDEVPKDSWRKLTFVCGIWYGLFLERPRRWPDGMTPIDAEYLRYGFHRIDEDGRLRLPLNGDRWKVLLRPLLLVSRVDNYILKTWYPIQKERIKRALEHLLDSYQGKKIAVPWVKDAMINTYTYSAADRAHLLQEMQIRMGPIEQWGNSEYRELVDLARKISVRGSHLVVLDLPIAPWLSQASPFHRVYQDRKTSFFNEIAAIPRVRYVSIQGLFDDTDFLDHAHPQARVTPQWASRAALAIAPSLEE